MSGGAENVSSSGSNHLASLARKYKLTLLFVATAVLVISIATFMVNQVIGGLAEENLVRIAEENTVRDAEHMQAMMRRDSAMPGERQSMAGIPPTDGASGRGESTGVLLQVPTTMVFLALAVGLS